MGEELLRPCPKLFLALATIYQLVEIEYSGEYSGHISVNNGFGEIVCERRDCTGGVFPDAWEREDLIVIRWKFSSMFFADSDGGFLQVSHPAVVSESFPGAEYFLFGGLCDRCGCGELRDEFCKEILIENRADLGLLEHDFRDEDEPWI